MKIIWDKKAIQYMEKTELYKAEKEEVMSVEDKD